MITFSIQAHNGNYYRGHEPSNTYGNCWCGNEEDAMVFTIEQAREFVCAWSGFLKIVISAYSKPVTDKIFQQEIFCAKGGSWYDYKESKVCE